jgi:hypothetical protein
VYYEEVYRRLVQMPRFSASQVCMIMRLIFTIIYFYTRQVDGDKTKSMSERAADPARYDRQRFFSFDSHV